jgi:CubicO group peptidase (beta-lactamase class C family)
MSSVAIDIPGFCLANLAETERLQAALAAAMRGATGGRASVAVRSHGGTAVATVGGADEAVPIGCVAKLVTAALVRAAVQHGRLSFDDDLETLLGASTQALRGIRLRHLLEHTHGLDDSALAPPRWLRGFVDVGELLGRAAALRPFAAPGTCYSYGHLGAWLAAAALERVLARRYSDLARGWLHDPLGGQVPLAAGLCPATGLGLALDAAQLARLLAHAVAGPERWPSGGVHGSHGGITPLPGWNPLERGVFVGFKHAGRSWFGHQSAWPGASAYLRAQPATGFAVAVLARTHAAAVIAARLLSRDVPELFELRAPGHSDSFRDDDAWCGRYEQAALAVDVATTDAGLGLTAHTRDAPCARLRARLVPAGAQVCFTLPSNDIVPYVQLVAAPSGGAGWLWNGRCVLRPAHR